MDSVQITGNVDDHHRLTAEVPSFVPPGPVTVWIAPTFADDAEQAWAPGISREWSDELADERQDIYTLADGEAVDPT